MLLSSLKHNTQDLHDALEQESVMQELVNGKGSLILYTKILQVLLPLYYTLKTSPNILSWCKKNHPNSVSIRGADLIKKELSQYGINKETIEPLNEWADWNDESQIIGSLYVIEGSSLGGKQISKALKKHYNITIEPENSFFNPYGKNCVYRWQNFKSLITNQEQRINKEAAIESARKTFIQYKEGLECVKGARNFH